MNLWTYTSKYAARTPLELEGFSEEYGWFVSDAHEATSALAQIVEYLGDGYEVTRLELQDTNTLDFRHHKDASKSA